jgi:hypothetical protein
MGNINDEITDLLLELNLYCFEKHIEFEIDIEDDKVKSSIKKTKKDGEVVIHVILGEYEDNNFLNRLTKFMTKLKSKPS